jgi:hypothetical protein
VSPRAPDFVVVGAMRAGTTALATALDSHPDVFMCRPKEPNYFACLHGALEYQGPGDQWFARQNTVTWQSYQALFADAGGRQAGEASAMYLALPDTAWDVAKALPGARVVVVLRDPSRRAASAHAYLRSRGRETVSTLPAALEAEERRKAAGYGPIWWYAGASDYRPGLQAYAEALGPDRVHVVVTEELQRCPGPVLEELAAFLDIRDVAPCVEALGASINASGAPRSRVLTRALYPPDRLRRAARRASPEWVRTGVRRAREHALASGDTRAEHARPVLLAEHADIVADVEDLLRRPIEEWARDHDVA